MINPYECIDKKELAELRRRAALYEEHKPKQWEPPKGNIKMFGWGEIQSSDAFLSEAYCKFGMAFTSIEQAEEAKPLIRSRNRLIRYVQEHGGIQKFRKGAENWTVNVAEGTPQSWCVACDIGAIWMTKDCAKSLAAGRKDGSIIL